MNELAIKALTDAELLAALIEADDELGDQDDDSDGEAHYSELVYNLEYELCVVRGLSSPL